MAHGKTIEMFLAEGTAEGLVTAELSNWNGKAIKIPRGEVADCTREDIASVGVYFLFCKDDDGGDSVYVGEAENVQARLKQHLADSFYWNTAVMFVGRDLNKALIRYLEDNLVRIVRECGRDRVLTKNTYQTHLNESQISSMNEFIDDVKTLISALGYKALTPMPVATNTTTYLHCLSNSAKGTGFVSTGGFTVLKDSTISDHTVPSFEARGRAYFDLRNRLTGDGTIMDRVFVRDYEFSAPSAASAVILGRTSNGNIDWRADDGRKLRDLQL